MQKTSNIKQRMLQVIDFKKDSRQEIFKKIGATASTFREPAIYASIKSSTLQKFLAIYPGLNLQWLLIDSDKPFAEAQSANNTAAEPHGGYNSQAFVRLTDKLIEQQLVPVFDITASANLHTLFVSGPHEQQVNDFLRIPNMPKVDGAVYASGDSMHPLVKSGDLVAYKVVNDLQNGIFWGEMYLLSLAIGGDYHVAIKYIQRSNKGSDYVLLTSHNNFYEAKEVALTDIKALAQIKVVVRYCSMQ